jgi:glycosyl transferase family 87
MRTSLRNQLPSATIVLPLVIMYSVLGVWLRGFIRDGRSDFISYYTAAKLIKQRPNDLYDLTIQAKFQDRILASLGSPIRFADGLLAYNHPPFEIVWFVPLANLSYVGAFSVWVLTSLICFAVGIWLLIGDMKADKVSLNWLYAFSFLFLPVLTTLFQGQDSGMLFLLWVLTYRSLRLRKDGRAGLWLSLLLQKFQLLIPSLLLLLLKKQWKVLAGFMGGSAVLLMVSWALVGSSGLVSYGKLLLEMSGWVERRGIYPSQMHNFRGQFYALLYPDHVVLANVLTIAASLLLLVMLAKAWGGNWEVGSPDFDLKFAFLLTTSLLVSPHLNFHDLSLLLLPALLICRLALQQPTAAEHRRLMLGLLMIGFPLQVLSFSVSRFVPINLNVLGILWATLMIWRQIDSLQKAPLVAVPTKQ